MNFTLSVLLPSSDTNLCFRVSIVSVCGFKPLAEREHLLSLLYVEAPQSLYCG